MRSRFALPAWVNQEIVLYHGTTVPFAEEVVRQVDVRRGRRGTDFGPGFYCTTVEHQAWTWAEKQASQKGADPAPVQLRLSRNGMAMLETMSFVLGDFDASDYWSFVTFCRHGALHHARGGLRGAGMYDVVFGPVSAFWEQRVAMHAADQVSFHTKAAETFLNESAERSIILG